jgi:uncharacterized protein (TIGR03437 family)
VNSVNICMTMLKAARYLAAILACVTAASGADCTGTSTGFVPLNDPFFLSYQGFRGGLYPDGKNHRPTGHEAAGLQRAAEVQPRDATGAVDQAGGKIVLLSIGMSNTTQEFSVFKKLADQDPERNPKLVIVDGAQGGWSADRIVAGGDRFWAAIDTRLAAAGVTAAQVQAGWMKEADARPALPFPEHARRLQSEMQSIAQTLRARFPNLRIVYLSGRTYGGYASTALNPEPYGYESGFAVKWLIEAQIRGDPELSFTAGRAPWLAWGPYLWADGTKPRDDGLVWNCSDFQQDGTHPSDSGRKKVAGMLLNFMKSDTTSRPWFVRQPAQAPPEPKAAAIVNAATYGKEVTPNSIATIFGSQLSSAVASAPGTPLPTVLAGTMILVGGEPALLYYVSPDQINWVIPKAPAGQDVVVVKEGVASKPLNLSPAFYAPGIFTLDSMPDGPAAALHADNRVIDTDHPAARGETIQLFLTGLGVRNPLLKMPEILPVVLVGDISAQLMYSGPAPAYPGMDQINFIVPLDAPAEVAVPLSIQFGSTTSNHATLAIF